MVEKYNSFDPNQILYKFSRDDLAKLNRYLDSVNLRYNLDPGSNFLVVAVFLEQIVIMESAIQASGLKVNDLTKNLI